MKSGGEPANISNTFGDSATNIPLVDLGAQNAALENEIGAAIEAVISSSAFIGGHFVETFEAEFAAFCGTRFAVGCGNGTDALRLVLQAFAIGPGDEVVLPSHTFYATAEAVLQVGARPVFAELEEDGFTLDPDSVSEQITQRTRCLIPVHLYGHPCQMEPLLEIARRHDLRVIEDCAQAAGARYRGRPVGSMGDAGCFSFYPSKNLGALGDGGAIVTSDPELVATLTRLRDHASVSKYRHQGIGWNSRLDGLQAAVLSVKLPHLERWNEKRRTAAAIYHQLLESCEGVALPRVANDVVHAFHLYVVRVPHRDSMLAELNRLGIGAAVHYPVACHQQAFFRQGTAERACRLSRTESVVDQILSLPIYPEIEQDQQRIIAETLLLSASSSTTHDRVS